MTTRSRTTTTLMTGLVAMLAGGLIGCQDREIGLTIRQVQPFNATECAVSTDPTSALGSGLVDVALRNSYGVFLFVENNMFDVNEVKGFDVTDSRVNTTRILLRSATIEYSTLDVLSAEPESPRTVPLSGTVDNAGNIVLGLEIFDAGTLQQLRSAQEFLSVNDNGQVLPVRSTVSLIARIRVAGETVDGKEVESNEFLFPVDMCNGCSVTYPGSLLEQRGGRTECPRTKLDPEGNQVLGPSLSDECIQRAGADGKTVDCQTCYALVQSGFEAVCRFLPE